MPVMKSPCAASAPELGKVNDPRAGSACATDDEGGAAGPEADEHATTGTATPANSTAQVKATIRVRTAQKIFA